VSRGNGPVVRLQPLYFRFHLVVVLYFEHGCTSPVKLDASLALLWIVIAALAEWLQLVEHVTLKRGKGLVDTVSRFLLFQNRKTGRFKAVGSG
jgi:hypothetical protein